jgi:hypothetical protein
VFSFEPLGAPYRRAGALRQLINLVASDEEHRLVFCGPVKPRKPVFIEGLGARWR